MIKTLKKFLSLKIPLYVLLVLLALFTTSFYWLANDKKIGGSNSEQLSPAESNIEKLPSCGMVQIRLHEGRLTHPLVMADINSESSELLPAKSAITNLVNSKAQANILRGVSVYLRKLNGGSWISVYGENKFNPGSLGKVPILIAYLKESETNPELLSKKIQYRKPSFYIPPQTYDQPTIMVEGQFYTVKKLLHEMAAKSDNYATGMLLENLNWESFEKTFTDLGLPAPPKNDLDFRMSASDYSRFFRVLYSASYLNRKNSEYALSILTECTFKDGMAKSIPNDIIIAHKFGEYNDGQFKELHESGIIYFDHSPYLLTIMTEGSNIKLLAQTISEITHVINSDFSNL